MSAVLDALALYGAQTLRVVLPEGSEEVHSEGGGLVATVDAQGMGPIATFLSENPTVQAVELQDADVVLRVSRHGGVARVEVRWSGGEAFEEVLALPATAVGAQDAGVFVPDALVENPLQLIHDPGSEVYVVKTENGPAFASSGTMGAGAGALPPSW